MRTATAEPAVAIVEETVGRSSKQWALVVVALVVGALAACWWMRRARSIDLPGAPDETQSVGQT